MSYVSSLQTPPPNCPNVYSLNQVEKTRKCFEKTATPRSRTSSLVNLYEQKSKPVKFHSKNFRIWDEENLELKTKLKRATMKISELEREIQQLKDNRKQPEMVDSFEELLDSSDEKEALLEKVLLINDQTDSNVVTSQT